jgi:ubiquinone/menaquinone biosynthesis C-methylase UbiE
MAAEPPEERGYQLNFAASSAAMFDVEGRQRKARTMVAVLGDFLARPLGELRLLNVGGSAGIIDNHLAGHFQAVVGVDIDVPAIVHADRSFRKHNLSFAAADALALPFPEGSFDAAVCSQVYEHVPDAQRMIDDIFRVLAPGGVCYFAASNRFRWEEPNYGLPLLSAIPRPLAHRYVRWFGRAERYHELHYSYWGLRRLVRRFRLHDYTRRMIQEPEKFGVDYMLPPSAVKTRVARLVAKFAHWLTPGYIWLLEKPDPAPPAGAVHPATAFSS